MGHQHIYEVLVGRCSPRDLLPAAAVVGQNFAAGILDGDRCVFPGGRVQTHQVGYALFSSKLEIVLVVFRADCALIGVAQDDQGRIVPSVIIAVAKGVQTGQRQGVSAYYVAHLGGCGHHDIVSALPRAKPIPTCRRPRCWWLRACCRYQSQIWTSPLLGPCPGWP